MKFIGHVSTAIIAAAPVIYFREHLPEAMQAATLTNRELLMWTGFWGVIPDIDIILQRYLPVKHRGFLTHSLWSALLPASLILGYYFLSASGKVPEKAFFCPLTTILAIIGCVMHVLGDSITKTGVPLLAPNKTWHFPGIGGKAAFDNYFLNAIPLGIAGWILYRFFDIGIDIIRKSGNFRLFDSFLDK